MLRSWVLLARVLAFPSSELLVCACCPAPRGLPPAHSSFHRAVSSSALVALSSSGKPLLDLTHGQAPLAYGQHGIHHMALSFPEPLKSKRPPRALHGSMGSCRGLETEGPKRIDIYQDMSCLCQTSYL